MVVDMGSHNVVGLVDRECPVVQRHTGLKVVIITAQAAHDTVLDTYLARVRQIEDYVVIDELRPAHDL